MAFHLGKGRLKGSWYYESPQLQCTSKRIEEYLDKGELDPMLKEIAVAKGISYWEKMFEDALNAKTNRITLQLAMEYRKSIIMQRENEERQEYEKQFDNLMRLITQFQESKAPLS